MADQKTPIHKHAHPVYGWVALIVSAVIILGIAGWYYITISDGYNQEVVDSAAIVVLPAKETTATSTWGTVDVATETSAIDSEIDSVLESDMSDAQLDNTILGIQ